MFPEGVPGVSKGVPPELMKGYQSQPDEATAAAPPEETRAETGRQAETQSEAAKPTPTWRRNISRVRRSAQGQQGQWPSQQKPASQQSAWPRSPQPGTFSR